MSGHVLFKLLKKLRERDKMLGTAPHFITFPQQV